MSRSLIQRTYKALAAQHAAALALIVAQRAAGIAPNPKAPLPQANFAI